MAASTNPPRLPQDGKLKDSRMEPNAIEPDKRKQAIEPNDPLTGASPVGNSNGELDNPEDNSSAARKKDVGEPATTMEYAKGIQMFFIMPALVLSITLCALDQVRSGATSPSCRFVFDQYAIRSEADVFNPDYCCDRYPKDHRPIRQDPRLLMARFGVFSHPRSVPVAVGRSVQIL